MKFAIITLLLRAKFPEEEEEKESTLL